MALVAVVCFTGFLLPSHLKRKALTASVSPARQVGLALNNCSIDFDGKYPDNLEQLFEMGSLTNEDRHMIYADPSDSSTILWEYTPGLSDQSDGETVILRSKEPHEGKIIEVRVNNSVKVTRVTE